MHPDQSTPDGHRYQSPDSAPERAPEQDQSLPEGAETTSQTVATPDPEGDRVAEAGNAYVGRTLDDDLKENPRVEDADRALEDEEE